MPSAPKTRKKTAGNRRGKRGPGAGRKTIHRMVENDLIQRVSYDEYRQEVQKVYGGPKGALLATCSLLSLHMPLGKRLLRKRKFDLRGLRNILDVGSGAGQITGHLLKYADPGARVTGFDLSLPMLRRARARLKSDAPRFVTADLTRLPFPDASFDCVTCGYVLEHVPDPRRGLAELARVMQPGGRMLLLATENGFFGAWTSRLWCCQTYDRAELLKRADEVGLPLKQELWFTRAHQWFRSGGICVELEKRA